MILKGSAGQLSSRAEWRYAAASLQLDMRSLRIFWCVQVLLNGNKCAVVGSPDAAGPSATIQPVGALTSSGVQAVAPASPGVNNR